jgi:hypothetical protein
MWIPAGGIYLAAALALLASWLRAAEDGAIHRGETEFRERDEVGTP